MQHDLWVFGYGSLMWRPGFPHVEVRRALLRGWHRELCVVSIEHRGTERRPGVVLGLDRGGSCRGLVFRVPAAAAQETIAYLTEREMGTYSYRQVTLPVATPHGKVPAFTHVVERNHPHYAGALSDADRIDRIAHAAGRSGSNLDYMQNAVRHLFELGVKDRRLEALLKAALAAATPDP